MSFQRQRPILPRSYQPESSSQGAEDSYDGRSASACTQCRRRKTKCDRQQPICNRCSKHGTNCVYEPGKVDEVETLRHENQQLRAALAENLDVIWRLKAAQHQPAESLNFQLPQDFIAPSSFPQVFRLTSTIEGLIDINQQFRARSISLDAVKNGFNRFIQYTYTIFPIYTATELERILFELHVSDGKVRPGNFSELCSIAAVGAFYSSVAIAKDIRVSLYYMAKAFVGDLTESDTLRAIRVFALLGCFNLIEKSTVGLIYFDFGLRLCQMYGVYAAVPPPEVSTADFLLAKRLWRTIAACRAWMAATLGYSIGDEWSQNLRRLESFGHDGSTGDKVASEMTKIMLMKAENFETLYSKPDISFESVDIVRSRHREWYDGLPEAFRLGPHLEVMNNPQAILGIYYVHLQDLGSKALLLRRVLSQTGPASRPKTNLLVDQTNTVIWEGLRASRYTIRIIMRIHEASQVMGGPFRKCWVLILQIYTACLVLLYALVKGVAHGVSTSHEAMDMLLCLKGLEIINYHAKSDNVAIKFEEILQLNCSILEKYHVKAANELNDDWEGISANAAPKEYGFLAEQADETSDIGRSANNLQRIFCNPFSAFSSHPRTSPESLASKKFIFIGRDADLAISGQLEWTLELVLHLGTRENEWQADEREIIAGHFVSSPQPSGWSTFMNEDAFSD